MLLTENLQDLIAREESLDPELVPYLYKPSWGGHGLHHPLAIEPFLNLKCCALVNLRIREKYKELERARFNKNACLFIWLHERPYRVHAFVEIRRILKAEQYWSLLGEVWSDSENISEHHKIWKSLLRSKRPHKDKFMSEEERNQFAALPETMTVYRGYSTSVKWGISWTLDRDKAIWFARRFESMAEPNLLTGTVQKQSCFAYLTERGEEEIIVFPHLVQHIKHENL